MQVDEIERHTLIPLFRHSQQECLSSFLGVGSGIDCFHSYISAALFLNAMIIYSSAASR